MGRLLLNFTLAQIPFCILRIFEKSSKRDRQGQNNTKVEKSQFLSAKSITTLEMFDLVNTLTNFNKKQNKFSTLGFCYMPSGPQKVNLPNRKLDQLV